MSNGVTELDSFEYSTENNDKVMTLENHHNHTDGDGVAVAQVTQRDETCNNIQMEQRESTVKAPCSPPASGINSDDNISNNPIGTMPDTTLSTGVNSVNTNNIITLMQSSPPPHSYRHSRAYRHFKNPPQPHMCIRTTTESGEELFINVLSWTRIVIPQEPSDPIPLYGGMRVPPGSPRSPPIVFAVMANPEVLKDSGRHSKDPEERRAMVELMCDFVEAMNPGVKLVRNAVILKDRDISGELKDVWNAVQVQRDREREEQMFQQRQQQHYHNITTQQMFPKTGENNTTTTTTITAGSMNNQQYQYASQQEQFIDNGMGQMTMENEIAMSTSTSTSTSTNIEAQYVDNGVESNAVAVDDSTSYTEMTSVHQSNSNAFINENHNNKNSKAAESEEISNNVGNNLNGNIDAVDQTDAGNKADKNTEVLSDNKPNISSSANNNNVKNVNSTVTSTPTTVTSPKSTKSTTIDVVPTTTIATTTAVSTSVAVANNTPTVSLTQSIVVNATAKVVPTPTPAPTPTPITTPPTKKDKLGGFLPNGCIFPRFKHSKNKDKDKDKEKEKDKDKDKDKESKGKDKEKTLLNALKKSKEKKVAPSEQLEKTTTTATTTTMMTTMTTNSDAVDTKSQYEKNFINLESEVQKLDLNKIDATTGSENSVFIKLKMSTSSAVAK